MDGLLIIDKPVGPTSHDVVARARRALGERRIGHTGTLDPMASGVLPLVVGRATRLARFLSAAEKSYDAVVRLGVQTDSYDAMGEAVGTRYDGVPPDRTAVEQALEVFRGTFLQQPPIFSAKKIGGIRSHVLARQRRLQPGTFDTPRPVSVAVTDLQVVGVVEFDVALRLTCSAGFYVRTLAHDLGERLGIGGHLTSLRRTRSGDLRIEDAIRLDIVVDDPAAAAAAIVPMAQMLAGLPAAALSDEGVRRARHGQSLGPGDLCAPLPAGAVGFTRLVDPSGALVGVAEPEGDRSVLHPVVILM